VKRWLVPSTAALLPLAAALVLAGGLPRKDSAPAGGSIAEQIKAIEQDYSTQEDRLSEEFEKTASKTKHEEIRKKLEQLEKDTADRFLDLAGKHASDPETFPALAFLVFHEQHVTEALDLLARHHVESKRIGELCMGLSTAPAVTPRMEELIRAVAEKNPHEAARGLASLALARVVFARSAAKDREAKEREQLLAEAEKLALRVADKFAGVRISAEGRGRTAGEEARGLLFEVRHLAIGKTVPEIDGRDLSGKKLRLSDHRGKVVLLSFWASWCGPCLSMLPHERALVKRLAGKPFVLLGINGDDDLDAAREAVRKEGITWQSFCGLRGKDQPDLAEQWNIAGWPTLYLIDHQGVIRQKWTGVPHEEELDDAIDELVRAAERAKGEQ
jgi:thiol-disulfide isomerase/thioredoxin